MVHIPNGDSKEDIAAREKIISDVYRKWMNKHPSKRVFNNDLKDYVNVKFLSINETIRHAAKRYLSTLAVLQLDVILRMAQKHGRAKAVKRGNKNQSAFEKMLEMRMSLEGIGVAKMMVGVKRDGTKIQYCITVIK